MNPELKAQIDGMWTMTDINSNGEINFDEFFNFVKSGGEEAFHRGWRGPVRDLPLPLS